MRVKLSFPLLLLTLISVLALVACGSSSQSDAEAETADDQAAAEAAAAGYILPARASEHVGEEGTLRGVVVDYLYVTGKPGRPTLLLFDRATGFSAGSLVSDIKTPDTTSILIWREDKKHFPADFSKLWTGKTLCVTGTIELFDNKPVIIATDPSQIKLDC
jgi:hypothetical protein